MTEKLEDKPDLADRPDESADASETSSVAEPKLPSANDSTSSIADRADRESEDGLVPLDMGSERSLGSSVKASNSGQKGLSNGAATKPGPPANATTPARRRTLNFRALPVTSTNTPPGMPRSVSNGLLAVGPSGGGSNLASPLSSPPIDQHKSPFSQAQAQAQAQTQTQPPAQAKQAVSAVTPSRGRRSESHSDTPGSPEQDVSLGPMSIESKRRSPLNGVHDRVATYMTQLASKEARVVALQEQLKELQIELAEAQADVKAFRKSGNDLANYMGSQSASPLAKASTLELQHRAVGGARSGGGSRSPSPRRQPASKPKQRTEEFMDRGRRMVEEVGSQFWSFVEDVKTAAIGDDRPVRDARDARDGHERERPSRTGSARQGHLHPETIYYNS